MRLSEILKEDFKEAIPTTTYAGQTIADTDPDAVVHGSEEEEGKTVGELADEVDESVNLSRLKQLAGM